MVFNFLKAWITEWFTASISGSNYYLKMWKWSFAARVLRWLLVVAGQERASTTASMSVGREESRMRNEENQSCQMVLTGPLPLLSCDHTLYNRLATPLRNLDQQGCTVKTLLVCLVKSIICQVAKGAVPSSIVIFASTILSNMVNRVVG